MPDGARLSGHTVNKLPAFHLRPCAGAGRDQSSAPALSGVNNLSRIRRRINSRVIAHLLADQRRRLFIRIGVRNVNRKYGQSHQGAADN